MKIKLCFLFTFIILLITGCVSSDNDLGLQIVPPRNVDISIFGTWEIVQVLNQSSTTEDYGQWIGKSAIFSSHGASIADYYIMDVGYQTRRVDVEEYLLYNYKSFPVGYSFTGEEIDVISVMEEKDFFCEILKEKDDELILKIYDDSFVLKKISSYADEELLKNLQAENILEEMNDTMLNATTQRTGVLIGLRQTNNIKKSGTEVHSYRTLFISSENRNINPIIETQQILFPRKRDFWKIEVNNLVEGDKTEDILVAHNILSKNINTIQEHETIGSNKNQAIYRKINYVSNDYVSIEERIFDTSENNQILTSESLHILAVDSLPNIRSISIFDLLGKSGMEAIETGRKKILDPMSMDNKLKLKEHDENYGVERKLGHWFLKGRVSFLYDTEYRSIDYKINIIPPRMLVAYDDLNVPWTTVKDRVPAAVDLYTSPNKDIALVITKDEIMVFSINDKTLHPVPLSRVPLKVGETVIMAEWATGHYVENWKRVLENILED